jgi:hypothetical protein
VTPEELYNRGYADGAANASANPSYIDDENYKSGYEDGKGDASLGDVAPGTQKAAIKDDFTRHNAPPNGYQWTHEFRTPQKGEIYLTKNGNAGVAKTPTNERKRHILKAIDVCDKYNFNVAASSYCKLADGHPGRCSHWM